MKILVINPGSTSTKVALFEDTERIVEKKIDHSREELSAFSSIKAELPMRISRVKDFLHEHETSPGELDVIVSRGGMLPPFATVLMLSMTSLSRRSSIDPSSNTLPT